MRFEGRMISSGKATAEVVRLDEPLSFLGGVDGATGDIKVGDGGNVAGKVLVFPKGKGSTVGSFVMYDLMVHGKAPAAVINESAETIVATGAVISSIPMIDCIPSIRMFENGDTVTVDADNGEVEIHDIVYREVVSSVVEKDGRCILLKRPMRNRSFPGHWSLVAGKIEEGESPADAARREILEETRIAVGEPVGSMEPLYCREGRTLFKVYPFHFRTDSEPTLNEENEEFIWADANDVSSMLTVTDTLKVVGHFLG